MWPPFCRQKYNFFNNEKDGNAFFILKKSVTPPYLISITVISLLVPRRIGGPKVPLPQEV